MSYFAQSISDAGIEMYFIVLSTGIKCDAMNCYCQAFAALEKNL